MIISNELLRKVQLKELEILLEIKRICDANNIKYFLSYGSLIGAVRHQGFIPWDDDIDIFMLREDYERFLEIAPSQISNEYYVESLKSNPDYVYSFCKVKANNTIYREKCTASSNIHQGIWVDVMPLDNIYSLDSILLDKHHRKISIWQTAIDYNANIIKLTNPLSKVFFKVLSVIYKHKLPYKKEKQMKKVKSKNLNILIDYNLPSSIYKKSIFPKEYFDDIIQIDFEGHQFSAPAKYDEILKQIYGNYMEFPPIEEQINKHEVVEVKV